MLAPSRALSARFDPFSVLDGNRTSHSDVGARQNLAPTSNARARRRHRFRSDSAVARSTSPTSSPPWLCPSCSAPLSSTEGHKSLVCPQRHCYDVAKEGYVNLARSGRKAKSVEAGPAGDAPESLAARSRFFGAGHFDRVMDAAADAVIEVLERQKEEARVVLDAGCGEGSYLRRLSRRISTSSPPPPVQLLGVDVAKAAVRSAASRAQRESISSQFFAVASAFDLPLPDASVACALVAFAPLPSSELSRVLSRDSGAAAVVVGPGPDHFFGLKRAVYGEDRARRKGSGEGGEGEATTTKARGRDRRRVSYPLDLDGPAAIDLLTMTPYFWRASEETRDRLAREGLETEVDVFVDVVAREEL